MYDPAVTAGAASKRPPWWRLRLRVVGITFGAVAVIVAVSGCWMLSMPGRSFDGVAPPLTADERALRAELERHVRVLAEEIGERSVDLPEAMESAARHVAAEFEKAGFAPRREPFAAAGTTFVNVIAEVAGGAKRDEIVVVGGHYDSVRGSPGANDNATGVAATLAIARRLAASKPERTLRFIAFACEEPPCFQTEEMGSLVHARGCAARGENVVAMLALETLGCYRDEEGSQTYPVRGLELVFGTRANFVAFVGPVGSRSLVRSAVRSFRDHATVPSEGAALPESVPGVGWSDHWSFARIGVPAVMATDTAIFRDSAYHTDRDLPGRVDFERLTRTTSALVRVVDALAR